MTFTSALADGAGSLAVGGEMRKSCFPHSTETLYWIFIIRARCVGFHKHIVSSTFLGSFCSREKNQLDAWTFSCCCFERQTVEYRFGTLERHWSPVEARLAWSDWENITCCNWFSAAVSTEQKKDYSRVKQKEKNPSKHGKWKSYENCVRCVSISVEREA